LAHSEHVYNGEVASQ